MALRAAILATTCIMLSSCGQPASEPAQNQETMSAEDRLMEQLIDAKPGDVIEIRDRSKQLAFVLEATQLAERDVPEYVEADHAKMTATYIRKPAFSDVPYPVQMEPNLVVEFYSR